MHKKIGSILLFSGGLDSILAYYVLKYNNIKIYPIVFSSVFLPPDEALYSANKIGFDLNVVDFTEEQIETVKNPVYGYGKYANPCIDCHALMIKMAYKIMKEKDFQFITTGEVLGERPKSQSQMGIKGVNDITGIEDIIFRPLSAKLLKQTIPEKENWIKKEYIFGISGRSRKKQIELVQKWNIPYYPSPGGGCMLTEKIPGKIVLNLLENNMLDRKNAEIIGKGRYFILSDKCRFVLSRDEKETEILEKMKKETDIFLECKDIPGPVGILRGECTKKEIFIGASILPRYGKKCRNKDIVEIIYKNEILKVKPYTDEQINPYRFMGD